MLNMDIHGVDLVAWTQAWISMLALAWIFIMDIHASIDLKIHAGHGYTWCSVGSMDLSMDIHTCMDLKIRSKHGYPW